MDRHGPDRAAPSRRSRLGRAIAFLLAAAVLLAVAVALGNDLLLPGRIARAMAAQETALRASPPVALLPRGSLPGPVRAWLDAARAEDAPPPVRGFVAAISGRLLLPGATRWMDFAGEEFVSAVAPAFEWNIRLRLLPGVWVHVIDRYGGGEGSISSRAFGLWPIIDDRGLPALATTQLARWASLAPLVPDALALAGVVAWREAPGEGKAILVVRDAGRGTTVTSEVAFGEGNAVLRISSADRFERYAPGEYRRTGSIVRRFDERLVDGVRIPFGFRAIRIEPDGTHTPFLEGRYDHVRLLR